MSVAVFLLSDFGLRDTYVAQMKAVLLEALPPGGALVDLTHGVGPGDVMEGAFHLRACAGRLPVGSVVLAVVDPGVGTPGRRAVAAHAAGVLHVGPDNGLFGLLQVDSAWELPPPPPGSSRTFHGRDLFAPAAGRLAVDPGWTRSLREIDPGSLVRLHSDPRVDSGGMLRVTVAHVDRFGDVILWLRPGEVRAEYVRGLLLPGGERLPIHAAPTYAGGEGLLLIEGALGLMEIALDRAPAGAALGVAAGDELGLVTDP